MAFFRCSSGGTAAKCEIKSVSGNKQTRTVTFENFTKIKTVSLGAPGPGWAMAIINDDGSTIDEHQANSTSTAIREVNGNTVKVYAYAGTSGTYYVMATGE